LRMRLWAVSLCPPPYRCTGGTWRRHRPEARRADLASGAAPWRLWLGRRGGAWCLAGHRGGVVGTCVVAQDVERVVTCDRGRRLSPLGLGVRRGAWRGRRRGHRRCAPSLRRRRAGGPTRPPGAGQSEARCGPRRCAARGTAAAESLPRPGRATTPRGCTCSSPGKRETYCTGTSARQWRASVLTPVVVDVRHAGG
jgi:hypothetical protein